MKKLLLLSVFMIAMICFVQKANAQNTGFANFNLTMTVDKYIETTPSPINFNLGTTLRYNSMTSEEIFYGPWGEWDLAYANCPFSVTLAGDNPAGQNKPRFARAEVGTQGTPGFDILNTVYQIGFLTNGAVQSDDFGYQWGFGASSFPKTANISEAPHNGQVKMRMTAHVNSSWHPSKDAGIPIRQTLINSAFTNDQSADAGDYTCTMLVTLTAL